MTDTSEPTIEQFARGLKVLMLAPLWHPIAQSAPGGIETLLFQLVSALLECGCDVTLLASGDSSAEGRLVPVIERNLYSLMTEGHAGEYVYYEQRQLQLAIEMAPHFDIAHSNIGPGGFVLSSALATGGRLLHTIHTPVYGDMEWLVQRQPLMNIAAVSDFQAKRLRGAGAQRCQVVPNGIDMLDFTLNPRPGDGLLFLGRIEEGKGPDLAIETARSLGRPLVLAGPIIDARFFENRIKPFLDDKIRYCGVVDYSTKKRLLGESACMLLPFRHAESFGMVSLEAMACGTPVVALANGALPEIVENGVGGYLATDERELAPLVLKAVQLDRPAVRENVSSRFSIRRTAEGYVRLYQEMIGRPSQEEQEAPQSC